MIIFLIFPCLVQLINVHSVFSLCFNPVSQVIVIKRIYSHEMNSMSSILSVFPFETIKMWFEFDLIINKSIMIFFCHQFQLQLSTLKIIHLNLWNQIYYKKLAPVWFFIDLDYTNRLLTSVSATQCYGIPRTTYKNENQKIFSAA